jgi:integrase
MEQVVSLKSENKWKGLNLFQIYKENKWIPYCIPIQEIPNLEKAFEKLPKKHRINKNDRTPEFLIRRNKSLFLFSYLLALRPSEAVKLKFSDIKRDVTGRYYIFINGENNKTKKDRIIPMPDKLIEILKKWLEDFVYKKFWKDSEWLFPSLIGNHLSRYQWGEIFQKAIREAGLWKKHPTKNRGLYTAYSLRHTRAVEFLEKSGFDIWSVSKLLGHESIQATLCYLHVCPSIQNHFRNLINK